MTEINLRLYISIFPRSSTEASVTVEDFMQTTILMRTFYFSVLSFLFVSLVGCWFFFWQESFSTI
uniref:Uncharacterized protein n=1 Tax=Anser brachyrhynchus TaxID=132585 RepID=A0A8B9IAH0_9AVES